MWEHIYWQHAKVKSGQSWIKIMWYRKNRSGFDDSLVLWSDLPCGKQSGGKRCKKADDVWSQKWLGTALDRRWGSSALRRCCTWAEMIEALIKQSKHLKGLVSRRFWKKERATIAHPEVFIDMVVWLGSRSRRRAHISPAVIWWPEGCQRARPAFATLGWSAMLTRQGKAHIWKVFKPLLFFQKSWISFCNEIDRPL